jgi:hypothetical protein
VTLAIRRSGEVEIFLFFILGDITDLVVSLMALFGSSLVENLDPFDFLLPAPPLLLPTYLLIFDGDMKNPLCLL